MAVLDNISKGMTTGNIVAGLVSGIGVTLLTPLVVMAVKKAADVTAKGGTVLLKKSEPALALVGEFVKTGLPETLKDGAGLLGKGKTAIADLGGTVTDRLKDGAGLLDKGKTAIVDLGGTVTDRLKGLALRKKDGPVVSDDVPDVQTAADTGQAIKVKKTKAPRKSLKKAAVMKETPEAMPEALPNAFPNAFVEELKENIPEPAGDENIPDGTA